MQSWRRVLGEILGHDGAAAAFAGALDRNAALLAGDTAADLAEILPRLVADALDGIGAQDRARLADMLRVPSVPPRPGGFAFAPGPLPKLVPEGQPGISLVTCCGNRNRNLVRALPSWLAQDAISEVVIVDWSSDTPVEQSLAEAGLSDPRIRIVRVEGEPRWILSHAFNTGFRAASCATILKADADILLAPDFFRRNLPAAAGFLAGNWRTAGAEQEYINGFFLAPRRALAEVGGFNEHIRSYGWDDEDLYQRLAVQGYRRIDVAPGSVTHLDHDDEARTGQAAAASAPTAAEEVRQGTVYLIRKNRFIANAMPEWSDRRQPVPFGITEVRPDRLVLRRGAPDPSAVPDHVVAAAEEHATIERAAWALAAEIRDLDPALAMRLLSRPLARLSRMDVLLARQGRIDVAEQGCAYLLLRIDPEVLGDGRPETLAVLRAVGERARGFGLQPVVQAEAEALPQAVAEALDNAPLLPAGVGPGPTTNVLPRLLFEDHRPEGDVLLRLRLTAETVQRLSVLVQRGRRRVAPAPRRGRIFVDAQHGLGNRLRAIASAAAIAEAAQRELVIVWEPDVHCDCRLSDLFDYGGEVLERRFLATALSGGLAVANYMPHEEGGQKNAPIRLAEGRDLYVRSAFVLSHRASTWESENRFLRALVPAARVRDLVAGAGQGSEIGVHVRMEGGTRDEHLPYESAANWTQEDHALIDHWRKQSQYGRFMQRIDALSAARGPVSMFLAADRPEAYDAFLAAYGSRVACLRRGVFDRSAEQLCYALADAIMLSRTPRLLGSTWSSFSELAMRLAPRRMAVEMSGKDF